MIILTSDLRQISGVCQLTNDGDTLQVPWSERPPGPTSWFGQETSCGIAWATLDSTIQPDLLSASLRTYAIPSTEWRSESVQVLLDLTFSVSEGAPSVWTLNGRTWDQVLVPGETYGLTTQLSANSRTPSDQESLASVRLIPEPRTAALVLLGLAFLALL